MNIFRTSIHLCILPVCFTFYRLLHVHTPFVYSDLTWVKSALSARVLYSIALSMQSRLANLVMMRSSENNNKFIETFSNMDKNGIKWFYLLVMWSLLITPPLLLFGISITCSLYSHRARVKLQLFHSIRYPPPFGWLAIHWNNWNTWYPTKYLD